jgi:hypothetical protein
MLPASGQRTKNLLVLPYMLVDREREAFTLQRERRNREQLNILYSLALPLQASQFNDRRAQRQVYGLERQSSIVDRRFVFLPRTGTSK